MEETKVEETWEIVEDFIHECIQPISAKLKLGYVYGSIRCIIAKNQIGNTENKRASFGEEGFYQYNGYVVVPKGHRDYGIADQYEYEFLKTHLINKKDIKKYKKGNPTEYLIHGGITFRDLGSGIYPKGEWVIGFDTVHLGDFEDIYSFGGHGWKKGIEYVRAETKRLAEQIARVEV